MLWIPLTLAAAFFQNLRSAAQRQLKSQLSDLTAASVRFLFALPFALLWLLILAYGFDMAIPDGSLEFVGWVIGGSVAQILFTFLLLRLFSFSNFAVGTALSKTEAVQVIILEAIILHESVTLGATVAIISAFIGVMVMTIGRVRRHPRRSTSIPCRFELNGATVAGHIIDLSIGGIGIEFTDDVSAISLEKEYLLHVSSQDLGANATFSVITRKVPEQANDTVFGFQYVHKTQLQEEAAFTLFYGENNAWSRRQQSGLRFGLHNFLALARRTLSVGLACGLFLGLSSVLFRGAALSLDDASLLMRSSFTLVAATLVQTAILLVWLGCFQPTELRKTFRLWPTCLGVGFTGFVASICWFTAFTITHVAYVRALGQIELVFTFLASVFVFKEKVSKAEVMGVIILAAAIVMLALEGTA